MTSDPGDSGRFSRRMILESTLAGALAFPAVSSTSVAAETYEAVSDGNWSDGSTWNGGAPPGDGSSVLVPDGITVTVSSRLSSRIKYVDVAGTLRLDPSQDTKLRAETIKTDPGSTFEMGTDSTPIQQGVTAEVEFIDEGPIDESTWPNRSNKGLIAGGDLDIVGAAKTPWTTLAQAPNAGDTSVELSSEPTNWSAGDEIVTPGLEAYSSNSLDDNDEVRTVSSVSGTTVSFDTALEHDHVPPKSDLDVYVANLSRNARLVSENEEVSRRGHLMMRSPGSTVKYLETVELGRSDKSRDATAPLWGRGEADPSSPPNPRGRYAIHSHHTGPTNAAQSVVGCAVRGSPGWGIVNHDSNMVATDNVTFRVSGAGLVAEKGNEVGAFRRNFALRSTGSGEQTESRKGWVNGFANTLSGPPHNIDDFGHSGHGFWMQSPLVAVENNVMAGHRHTPITWWCRALYEEPLGSGEFLDGKHDMFPQVDESTLTDHEKAFGRSGDQCPPVGDCFHEKDATKYFTDSFQLRAFHGNEAFGCGGGYDISRVAFRNRRSKVDRKSHTNNTAYNIGELYLSDGSKQGQQNFQSSGNVGLDHRYVGNLVADNYRLLGTGDGVGVYNNFSYEDDFHVRNSTIENWETGLVPAAYDNDSRSTVRNTTFENNEVDIEIPGRLGGRHGQLVAAGNSYSGTTALQWNELTPPVMLVSRLLGPHSRVRFEGRTVYHGWSDPEFVIVQEGDTERLDKMLNRDGESWTEVLNGDNPRNVLPGATHQELYDEYGITFFGGLLSRSDGEERADFAGSGGTYDSTPFLGPTKSMPTDEIWIDAVNHMRLQNEYEVVQSGDSVQNPAPLQHASDETAVQLDSPSERDYEPPFSDTGIASYEFSVDKAGEYHVHVRVQQGKTSETPKSNDQTSRVHIRMDNGSWKLHDGNTGLASTGEFSWRRGWWATFDLSEGQHTIEIAGSGWGMRLDRVLIKHDTVAANPVGYGKPHTT